MKLNNRQMCETQKIYINAFLGYSLTIKAEMNLIIESTTVENSSCVTFSGVFTVNYSNSNDLTNLLIHEIEQ